MTALTADIEQPPPRFERVIGSYRGDAAGASVVCVAGIHGNEVSGIHAARRVLRILRKRKPLFRGEFVGIAGNLSALERGDRYLAEDLNRVWTEQRIEALQSLAPDHFTTIEHEEMWGLLSTLNDAFGRARGETYFLDLHTSSASGGPFVLLGDTIRNRRLAFRFPAPVILGLEETIDGVLLEYVNSLGHVTVGFEAGQHDDPDSIDNQESAIWIGLLHAGCIDGGDVPEAVEARRRLARRTRHLPRIMELRYRKPVSPEDDFRMNPGYTNFQSVKTGDIVATDRNGEVRVKESGRLLLPLYQGQGSDGFFLARDVQSFWLYVSSALRHLHAHQLVRILPGIWKHPSRPDTFVVNRRVARWFPMQILHLLGFRKVREEGENLTVSRRRYDIKPPDRD